MATKKQRLGRGYASLIPQKTIAAEEPKKAPPPVHPAVSGAALLIADATRGMDASDAETMLHMIIRLCQFQLENGYVG